MDDTKNRFFKVNYSIWEDIHFQALRPEIKLIYIALCSFKGGKNSENPGKCWPSIDKLSQVTGITRSKISEYITYLNSGGFIIKDKVRQGKKNICIYTIPDTPLEPTQGFFNLLKLDQKQKKKKAVNAAKARKAKQIKSGSKSIPKTTKEVDSLQNREGSQSIIKTGTSCINITRNNNKGKKVNTIYEKDIEEEQEKDWLIPTLDDLF